LPERNIGVKVDDELFKKVKIKIAHKGITMREYILELILRDLEQGEK